jgi:hypothetical protein
MPVILATWETKIRRIKDRGHSRQIVYETPISKITKAKWTGDMANAVELLLYKFEALSSNSSPTNKKYLLLYLNFSNQIDYKID